MQIEEYHMEMFQSNPNTNWAKLPELQTNIVNIVAQGIEKDQFL